MATATISGGVQHGLAILSNAERQAAQGALAKISAKSASLGSHLGGATQSATLFGGSFKTVGLSSASLAYGSGNDTFAGGARTSMALGVGNDTVVGGSAHSAGRVASSLSVSGAHTVGNFSLSSDTINIAGATATSVKAVRPEETSTKSHTVTLTDKTTVNITGLSTHDMSKFTH